VVFNVAARMMRARGLPARAHAVTFLPIRAGVNDASLILKALFTRHCFISNSQFSCV
jgi:hypothetical protein